MPYPQLPFMNYVIGSDGSEEAVENLPVEVEIPDGEEYQTPLIDIMGRRDKMLWLLSNKELTCEIYVAPHRKVKPGDWYLYKKDMTINANDPFMFFSNDPLPYVSIKVINSSGSDATMQGHLFAQ